MAARRRATLRPKRPPSTGKDAEGRPLLYTAQDVARFCQVDLKTIHHWANAGKIPHHRTLGRHLRFRHGPLVAFLQSHGYPLSESLTRARPSVFLALGAEGVGEAVAKKLAARFTVRAFSSGLSAVAHLVEGQPDALVLGMADPTWSTEHALSALKGDPSTSWATLVVVGAAEGQTIEGADLVVPSALIARLPAELARRLGVGAL